MGYISQENLVQNMTPEQRIMIASFYAKFDVGSGIANKKIINVELLLYNNSQAGSEFTIYNANKMYIALALGFEGNFNTSLSIGKVEIYDENNNVQYAVGNNIGFFNVTNLFIFQSAFNLNTYFSRIISYGYNFISFNGYRITLI